MDSLIDQRLFYLPSDLSGFSFHESTICLPLVLGSGSRGIPDGPRSFRMEQLDSGRFPGSIRKDLDGNIHTHPGEFSVRVSASNILVSQTFGSRDLPKIFHAGEHFGRGRISIGDPILGGSYGRDFANEAGLFSTV